MVCKIHTYLYMFSNVYKYNVQSAKSIYKRKNFLCHIASKVSYSTPYKFNSRFLT